MIMATAGRQKLKWRAKRLRPTHHLHLVIVGTSNGNVLEHSSTVDPEALTDVFDAAASEGSLGVDEENFACDKTSGSNESRSNERSKHQSHKTSHEQ